MNELRWILIGFGIVLLAAIYLWGRRGQEREVTADPVSRMRPEPTLERERSEEFDDPTSAPPASDAPVGSDREHLTAPHYAAEHPPPEERLPAPRPLAQSRSARVEPTFADATTTEELPSHPEVQEAPTLSSSESPALRRPERRKILSVRLAANPQRIEGARLKEALAAEALEYGKYGIFHRMQHDATLFSIASMVEPGSFDLTEMPEQRYPGVTFFAQLPGPAPGMHALNEMIACARKLQQMLGGTLQDERGVPLTVHRIERMRQEIREFERPAGGARGGASPSLQT